MRVGQSLSSPKFMQHLYLLHSNPLGTKKTTHSMSKAHLGGKVASSKAGEGQNSDSLVKNGEEGPVGISSHSGKGITTAWENNVQALE